MRAGGGCLDCPGEALHHQIKHQGAEIWSSWSGASAWTSARTLGEVSKGSHFHGEAAARFVADVATCGSQVGPQSRGCLCACGYDEVATGGTGYDAARVRPKTARSGHGETGLQVRGENGANGLKGGQDGRADHGAQRPSPTAYQEGPRWTHQHRANDGPSGLHPRGEKVTFLECENVLVEIATFTLENPLTKSVENDELIPEKPLQATDDDALSFVQFLQGSGDKGSGRGGKKGVRKDKTAKPKNKPAPSPGRGRGRGGQVRPGNKTGRFAGLNSLFRATASSRR